MGVLHPTDQSSTRKHVLGESLLTKGSPFRSSGQHTQELVARQLLPGARTLEWSARQGLPKRRAFFGCNASRAVEHDSWTTTTRNNPFVSRKSSRPAHRQNKTSSTARITAYLDCGALAQKLPPGL